MAVQTVYREGLEAGRPGAMVSTVPNTLISRTVEDAAIGFGLPVAQGANDRGIHKAKTGDTVILGINVRDRSAVSDNVPVGSSAEIMRKGAVWVRVGAAVEAGDPVHVVLADSSYAKTGGVAIVGARFDTSAALGEMAQVFLG